MMTDRNSIIGLVLIFILLYAWSYLNTPSKEQLAAQQRTQDSLALVKKQMEVGDTTPVATIPADSLLAKNGDSTQATVAETTHTLENEVFKVTFTNKGGRIKEVLLKNYFKNHINGRDTVAKLPLHLLEAAQNKFAYTVPFASGDVSTDKLLFAMHPAAQSVSFTYTDAQNQTFEQTYTLKPNSYDIDYNIKWNGLKTGATTIPLTWHNYLGKIEKNAQYERNYSSIYFNKIEENEVDYCNCQKSVTEEINEKVKWVSHAQQFFNSTLIAQKPFAKVVAETDMLTPEDMHLKLAKTQFQIPIDNTQGSYAMNLYVGPNEFERLAAYDMGLEDVISFGSSILGTLNRWVIRPVFNFLLSLIGIKGIAILALTLLVKLLLYPLTYKMIYSQSKMAALKPELDKLRAKHGDDQQKIQMESMALYREFGVNPLGGCLPMLLQMPIWLALYRFFPAAIEFRQASFLWANDLSSYDVFFQLPFNIPFYGDHFSLFSFLWVITTLIYTYYSTKDMDFSANPAMKYMQYIMPVIFVFFFNSVAAGLSCYLLFSNILNIAQTLVTRNYVINQDKIKAELQAYKSKPKKKSGFAEKLESVMKEQQRIQQEREKQRKK